MLKNVNVGVLDMINSMAKGTFKSGEKNFGLSNNGVGYSTAGGNIDPKTKAKIDGLIKDIMAKKIVVPTKM
jgi:basic membrane protein A